MYLTVSKRFEISLSHRMYNANYTDEENMTFYGDESKGVHGHGHNIVVTFLFHGPIQADDGMVVNVTIIKEKINQLLKERYDHKFLNADIKPFDTETPTFEKIVEVLFQDAKKIFETESAKLVACHICEDCEWEATAFEDGKIERSYHQDFCAARRTYSPNLTVAENEKLYGVSARKSGHGHHYNLRVTFRGEPPFNHNQFIDENKIQRVLNQFYRKYDHRNFTTDIEEFHGMPLTTESLTRFFFLELHKELPIDRIRLNENSYFFIEFTKQRRMFMGVKSSFHAAHRLHAQSFTDEKNLEVYGKCNNLNGHGHTYKVEMLLEGEYDAITGSVYDLGIVLAHLEEVLHQWNYKHLNLETDDFKNLIPTGENICLVLWNKLLEEYGENLNRLSLWETANNRFTIRKDIEER